MDATRECTRPSESGREQDARLVTLVPTPHDFPSR